jgi:O-antigen/teichoic acid export membrane protein
MMGRRTTLILANTVAGGVFGFVALKVFAVMTGGYADDLLGQLAFAMGIAGLLSIVLDLGLGTAHVKRVSEGRDLAVATGSYAAAKVVLAAVMLALTVGGALAANAFGVLVDTPRLAVALVALYFVFLGLRTVFTATFDGRQEFAKSQLTVFVENLVRAPLVVLFALAFGGAVLGNGPMAGRVGEGLADLLRHHGGELLAACYALGALASLLAGLWLFRRGYAFGRPDRAVLRDYWGFARHILLAAAVGTVYVNLDKVVITAFWDPTHTGQYYGAQRFSDLIGMVPMAVYTVMFPTLSERFRRGDREEIRGTVQAALRHISMVVVPLSVFTFVLAGPLLSLTLTGEFQAAVPTLRLLSVYALLFALFYPYATLLHAMGRPDATARTAVLAMAVNAVLNLLLVPQSLLGVPLPGLAERGSALATVVAVGVQLALLRRAAHRLEGPVPARAVAKHLAAGAAMGLALWALASWMERLPGASALALNPAHAPLALVLGLFALGGLVYLAALWAMREFTRHDLQLYLHMLHPAEMARYVAEEVQARGPLRAPGHAHKKGP